MGMESPPFATQSGSFGAEQTRRAVFAWLARTSANNPGIVSGGLLSATDCQITAPSSGMTVNVSTGEAMIGGTEGGAQGAYYGRVSSVTNLLIATASGANPRIDTICLTVSDTGYTEPSGGSGSQVGLFVVTGTPTVGATLANLSGAASLPGSSLLLGYVLVPTSAANIVTADIANVAGVVAVQAALQVPQAAQVSTPIRTLSTTYQPNAARPVLVVANVTGPGSGSGGLHIAAISSGVFSAYPTAEAPGGSGVGNSTMVTLVPAGWWYGINNCTILQVTEFQL
jgi:hypothetical protein